MRRTVGDTFSEMDRLRGKLLSLLDASFPPPMAAAAAEARWTPRADIHADGEVLVATMEVPGVAREDLDVVVEGAVLTVSGQRPACPAGGCPPGERLLVAERPRGRFSRSFALGWQPQSHEARLRDGILTITLKP